MKAVIVTGGTGGIGFAICSALIKLGYLVIATCRNKNTKLESVNKLFSMGVHVFEADVTSLESCRKLEQELKEKGIEPYALVNNAGITSDSTMKNMKPEQWSNVINVNLTGTFNMTKVILEGMLLKKAGRIINISSVNALKGQFGQVNYSASKSGLIGFSKSLAKEVANKGITVNVISPGYIKTEMTKLIPDNILQNIIKSIPTGRLGEPEEVAGLVAYLISKEADFMTGSVIDINGGQF